MHAPVKGLLLAWDPVQQREAWRVEHAGAWNEVALGGALKARGMASFAANISERQSAAIRMYVIQQAQRAKALQEATASAPPVD